VDCEPGWVAPNVWAAIAGPVLLLIALAFLGPALVRWLVAGIGAALIIYFIAGYAAASRRGEVPSIDRDEPPGGWSNQGPYTSG
jgi:hypothetical protein